MDESENAMSLAAYFSSMKTVQGLHVFEKFDLTLCLPCSYLVTPLMDTDLHDILKCQALQDEHIKFLLYQILRGLKVSTFGAYCLFFSQMRESQA